MNAKIETTPAMRRFNEAVEQADYALVWCADRVTNPDRLMALLSWCGHFPEARTLTDATNALEEETGRKIWSTR